MIEIKNVIHNLIGSEHVSNRTKTSDRAEIFTQLFDRWAVMVQFVIANWLINKCISYNNKTN